MARLKYKKGKGKGKINYKKLMDKKINTALEVRMKQVADDRIAANRVGLIKRNFLFEEYDTLTNIFTPLPLAVNEITFAGTVVELSNIQKVDVDIVANAPMADIPYTAENENLDGDGIAQGMTVQTTHGRRFSSSVMLSGVSLEVVARLNYGNSAADLYDGVQLRYAIVAWKSPVMNTVSTTPSPELALPWHPFGWSSKLDVDERREEDEEKIYTLCKGSIFLGQRADKSNRKKDKIYKKLSRPLRLDFEDDDQNGQKPTNWKICAVFRSSIPNGATFDRYTPRVAACSKLYYYEQ